MKRWAWLSTGVALSLTLVLLVFSGGTPEDRNPESAPLGLAPRLPVPKNTGPTPVVPTPSGNQPRMRKLAPGEKPPQFVLFSFDGAASKEHWDRVLPITRQNNAHVTGLLSGVYLVADQDKMQYTGPGHERGYSSIGFGGSRQDVANRITYLNEVIGAGHELGTHYNGHFCTGDEPAVGKWDAKAWNDELDAFGRILDNARAQGLKLPKEAVRGGRTPCLEGDWKQAFPAMLGHGLAYDTSHVSLGVVWPSVVDGMWEFPMPEVKVPALGKQVVMMDFNLWFALNGAKEDASRSAEFTQIVVDTYRSVHRAAFNGNRAPIVIGNHFNEWAGGAFSKAVEQYMGEVCAQQETVCATYTEVIQWMQLQDPAVLEQLRRMPAAVN
ncbi:polysaccharide deacetylase [Lentzea tibetensis]|uniref:Polysaccharide deacetylase n=1 Tax=Lentzea tibetensis TaxID=2591470 RepID=A0A563EN85_9PSEU|nr:polysaccharide deacetylase [Lentzea tibetensis]